MRNADSMSTKTTRENEVLTWKIYHYDGKARVSSSYNTESVLKISVNPTIAGTSDLAEIDPGFSAYTQTDENNKPTVENGKFNINNLDCGPNNVKGYEIINLYDDDNNEVCLEPIADGNGLATVNQEVNVKLGDLNYRLFNFQGGHINNPFLSDVSATPDGYVTLPGITDPVRVEEKSNTVIIPSDIKIELDKAPSS